MTPDDEPPRAKLRVGLNAMFLTPSRGGMATAALELPGALRCVAPELELVVYVPEDAADHIRETQPWGDEVELATVAGLGRYSRGARVGAELIALPLRVRRDGIDVLHSLANLGPPRCPVPHVLTIHDLLFWHVPETHPGLSRPLLKVLTPMIARRATLVASPSRFTRDDLVATLGVSPGRARVVPNGPGKPAAPGDASRARRTFDLGDRSVVLSIGAGFAHKNIDRLVEAFARVGPQRGAVLVHVGPPIFEGEGWRARAVELGMAGDVLWAGEAGFVEDSALEDLFAAATLLVHPSLHEGFGLPPLEAMARGVPVACAQTSSLPEIAGDAAEYFDPLSVDGMASAIARLLDEPIRRADLITRGHAQSACFSWERNARGYAALYREAVAVDDVSDPRATAEGTTRRPRRGA